jgi:aspartyl-tRNA(Asn)/glutamyl-tRNA(Gln) amidotransferase subunit A
VQRRILLGTYVLSSGYYNAYYTQAQKVRQLIRKDFDEVFGAGIDCLLTPTTPFAAFELGTLSKQDPVKMYMNDVFTVTANLAGLPAISVPAGVSNEGLPLGLQIIGSSWGESMVLNAALAIENSAAFFYKPSFWWSQSACS